MIEEVPIPMEPLVNGSSYVHLVKPEPKRRAATLQGWKTIASELNRGVRTVQRWERDQGLPIHRIGKTSRSPVFAFVEELYSWLSKTSVEFPTGRPAVNFLAQKQESLLARQSVERFRFNAQDLRSTIAFLIERSSRCLSEQCEYCHFPLRIVVGFFRAWEVQELCEVSIVFCPNCDPKRIPPLVTGLCRSG